jgi:hypothetical protein
VLEPQVDWGFVLGLVVIFLFVISPLIYFGRKLSKYVKKNDPGSELVVSVTPVGNALTALLVGFWGACIITVKLAPKSAFGRFLDTPEGVATVTIGSILLYAIAASILKKLGFPISKKGSRDT